MPNSKHITQAVLHDNFNIYRLIARVVWVHSFRNKVFIIAFIGTHIPLIALISYILYMPGQLSAMAVFILALAATLVGSMSLLWALHHLLKPIKLSSLALESYLGEGKLIAIPDDLEDEMGALLRNLMYSLKTIEQRRLALEGIATMDILTGLGNRLFAQQKLDTIANITDKRTPDLCIALLDIDHFKKINDVYGHAAGDEVLAMAAKTMRATLQRESDWIARWGGEEFLILLNCSLADAQTILNKMRIALADSKLHFKQHTITFTASLGLSELKPNQPIKEGISRADSALYRAKAMGRNQLIIQE